MSHLATDHSAPQATATATATATAPVEPLVPAMPAASDGSVTLEVVHDTHYRYRTAVSLAHHLAHLQPLHDAHQQLHAFALQVSRELGTPRLSQDAYGNAQHHISLARAHTSLTVRAASRVTVRPRFGALQPEAGPAWDMLARQLRYVAGNGFQPAVEFALPSPYVPRLAALRAWADADFSPGRPVAAAAIALMHRLYAEFRYESRSTDIDTPLAQAFAQRRGVCQDFAHVLAGALRMLGLPARYVSGYLLTHSPNSAPPSAPDDSPDGAPEEATMVGADASHAWVQVWCPSTPGVPAEGPAAHWLDLDPTNDMVPGSGHVRVAVGRDFGDVTPLRGVIRGGGRHALEVGVSTRVVGPGPAAAA